MRAPRRRSVVYNGTCKVQGALSVCIRAGVCTLRNLCTVGGSQPVDVLTIGVIPAAPESLGMWLSRPPGTGHLVNGMWLLLFWVPETVLGSITAGSSSSLVGLVNHPVNSGHGLPVAPLLLPSQGRDYPPWSQRPAHLNCPFPQMHCEIISWGQDITYESPNGKDPKSKLFHNLETRHWPGNKLSN